MMSQSLLKHVTVNSKNGPETHNTYDEIHIINTLLDKLLSLSELEVGGWDEDLWQIAFE